MIGSVAALLVLGGCRREPDAVEKSATEPAPRRSLEPREPTIAEQIAAVRDGRSDRIHVAAQPAEEPQLRAIGQLGGLRTLVLDAGRVTDSEANLLAALENLRQLRLRHSPIGDAGLAELARIRTLQIVNLPHSRVTDQGPRALAELSELRQLRLGSRVATAEICEAIAELDNLRALHLIDIPVDDDGLERLATLPRLHSLYLDGAAVSDAGWQRLFADRPDLHVHVDQAHHDRDPGRHPHEAGTRRGAGR